LERSGKARSALPRSGKPGAPEGDQSSTPSPRPASLPNPEVEAKAHRRRFSAAQKRRIVEEAEACTQPGQIGALLRREGIYSSMLARWRKLYQVGALKALADDRRGRPAKRSALDDENERLRKENKRLEKRLKQAEAIIEIQKKISALLAEAETNEPC
jgi:transposase-like protein